MSSSVEFQYATVAVTVGDKELKRICVKLYELQLFYYNIAVSRINSEYSVGISSLKLHISLMPVAVRLDSAYE